MGGRHLITLCVKGKYFTKIDFGTVDELWAKYRGKAIKIVLSN